MAVSCRVEELIHEEHIWDFSYERLQEIKNDHINFLRQNEIGYDAQIIISDKDLDIPPETISFMKTALGKNSIGLSNVELTAKFLNITDCILRNDVRYEVPEYILSFPRHFYQAQLYIDSAPASCFEGEVTEYYRDDIDRYEFRNECIDMDMVLVNENMCQLGMKIHVIDSSVEKRISNLRLVMKVLNAKNLYLRFYSEGVDRTVRIPISEAYYSWQTDKGLYKACESWMCSLEKLKAIEEYYDIKFELEDIDGRENVEALFAALDFVYSGIIMKQNSYIAGPKPKELKIREMKIDEPIFLEEIPEGKREQLTIQGITFETDRSYIVPRKIKKRRGILIIPTCCECIVLPNHSA